MSSMERYLAEPIRRDLKRRMALWTGPRQAGKTRLAKHLMSEFKRPQYLTYENLDDARIMRSQTRPLNSDIVVFDGIRKMKGWKRFVKGVYDTRPGKQPILVTGSARLEAFHQAGESLAGR